MDKREYIKQYIIKNKNSRILEIGPLNRPIICKEEYPNSFYADIRKTEDIKILYSGNEYLETTGIHVDVETIEEIDFVLEKSYENTFNGVEKFDYIVASHVLEHTPNIIYTLRDISTILKKSGKLCIIYPDKRYCFDHFREEASFRDAYDVYCNGVNAGARMVFDFYYSAINENSPLKFWQPDNLESLMPINDFLKAEKLYKAACKGEIMDDVHYWPFSDSGFCKFLYDGVRADLLPFHCAEYQISSENTQEFLVVLEHNEKRRFNKEQELEVLKNFMRKIPLNYYNAQYIAAKATKIGMDNEIIALKKTISDLGKSLEQNENEFIKYRASVEAQQKALLEYDKVLKKQNEAINAYAEQRKYIETLEDEIKKYQLILKQNNLV